MSSFSESALERKLSELSNSQQSVQTLSLWLIHHRKHAGPIVTVWHRELPKSSRKLTFLYLANDVIQNSKRKGPEFAREFESVLVDAFSHVAREADEGCKKPLERLLNIWQERSVYGSEFIQQLKLSMEDSNSPQPKVTEEKKSLKRTFQQIQEEEDDDYPGSYSPQDANAGPLLTEDLVRALQDLENAASGDAAVRQKIASLPQEVQDVSLLEKITDKEAAERLSKTVDEACLLLAEYNGRLAAELEDRRQLARMLIEYTQNQKDVLTEKEKKLEASSPVTVHRNISGSPAQESVQPRKCEPGTEELSSCCCKESESGVLAGAVRCGACSAGLWTRESWLLVPTGPRSSLGDLAQLVIQDILKDSHA
ncbi:regulation of nuclear pre-mRNA domain-containing protein 1B isoform X2 [Varanus komodoensis]|uniref:regulation of nuclear pre-mRNA domain-containing protein 1B isoform X2 n=1 Tax=Varanus komodoensis TaxID=61221 RepID=UPI001CF7E352|nr:regulation of nuclear pre-mRNA domain-containing protein 1B isoform X2 [Varanus komodoensis]